MRDANEREADQISVVSGSTGPKLSECEKTKIRVHGVPLTFAEVDNPDQALRGKWIEYLNGSDSVKKAAPRIEKMHIGSLAHFYFTDAEIPFYCKTYEGETTLDRCENCPNWFRPDNECSEDAMGEYVEKQPITRDMALDTMHVLRVTLKEKGK